MTRPKIPLSSEQIRGLDGPALTRLAWHFGLAPPGARNDVDDHGIRAAGTVYLSRSRKPGAWDVDDLVPWVPDVNLPQAYDVFIHLRAHGWNTASYWYGPADYGVVEASRYRQGAWHAHRVRFGPAWEPEALALLRCAVLAVASDREQEATRMSEGILVGGRRIERSLADFERACETQLGEA